MKAFLTAAMVAGAVAASLPAWAGEGAGDPFPYSAPAVNTQMTVVRGGNTDPFRWSAPPTASQMTLTRGGNTDPFRWSANPISPAATRHTTVGQATRNPG